MDTRLLGFGFLLFLGSCVGQTFFVGLFADDVQERFGLSASEYGTLYSLATLTSAALLPFVGGWIDRCDLRGFVSAVLLGLTLSVWGMSFVDSVFGLALVLLGLRFFGQGLMTHTAGTTISRYFDTRRGIALSLVALGYSAGEASLPALVVWGRSALDWRQIWLVLAASMLLLLVPGVLRSLSGHSRRHRLWAQRQNRTRVERSPRGVQRVGVRVGIRVGIRARNRSAAAGATPARGHRRRAGQWLLLRDPRFLLLLPAVLVPPFVGTGVFFHHKALCAQKGWDAETWATAFAVYAVVSVVASLLAGRWVDRSGARLLFPLHLIPQGLALLLLWVSPSAVDGAGWSKQGVVFGYMIGAGISNGSRSSILGSLWAEVYGVERIGGVRSVVQSFMVLSTAAAPGPLGKLLDDAVSFETIAFGGVWVVTITSLGAAWGCWLSRDRPRKETTPPQAGRRSAPH